MELKSEAKKNVAGAECKYFGFATQHTRSFIFYMVHSASYLYSIYFIKTSSWVKFTEINFWLYIYIIRIALFSYSWTLWLDIWGIACFCIFLTPFVSYEGTHTYTLHILKKITRSLQLRDKKHSLHPNYTTMLDDAATTILESMLHGVKNNIIKAKVNTSLILNGIRQG